MTNQEVQESFVKLAKVRLVRVFSPFVNSLKFLGLIPRSWFPAIYIGNREVNVGVANSGFPSNHVSNTKYTWFTFPLHNVLEQFFMSHMNRYFILVALVQLWQVVSPVNPLTTWIPLILVFAITAMFAAIDDMRRRIGDKNVNNRHVTVLRKGELIRLSAKDIYVGDFVRLRENEEIPCDLVILQSSGKDGLAFIQTANLDGEIDLKSRPVPRKFYERTENESGSEFLTGLKAKVTCPQPDPEIYAFNSTMKVRFGEEEIDVSLSAENLLLQSCLVKNTDWVVGVCVYNGNETKCGMNKRRVPSKRARSDNFMDSFSWFVFGFQFLIFVVFGIIGTIFKESDRLTQPFLRYRPRGDLLWWEWYDFIVIPVRFWLLTTYMIPISLKVTLDFMKLFYSLLVIYDREMYDPETRGGANARNQAIMEDLGQIEYILTDKTGTLTQNVMEFQRCGISTEVYGSEKQPATKHTDLIHLVEVGDDATLAFVRVLALCHTCARETGESGEVVYRSPSPDEEALVKAAAKFGVVLFSTEDEVYVVELNGCLEKWKVVRVLKFTSDRKRMSVLLSRTTNDGELFQLFSKGADDVMLGLVDASEEELKVTRDHLGQFARLGLRTLVCGSRKVEVAEYKEWASRMDAAENVVGDDRGAAVAACYVELEKGLKLVGTTAIEDKLQDQVPETIALLRQAGIAIWMLTGDKFETAKQIGYSCNLVSEKEKLVEIVGNSQDAIGKSIEESLRTVSECNAYSLIIEGQTIALAFEFFETEFKELCLSAKTVVCARVTPSQKALIVKLVKKQGKMTLAIGDGGNDVPMIQEAHVGVGLTGKEGLQASRAADFAFGKFKFLRPLVFIHGNYSLFRSGLIIQYSFYKNIVMAFLQVLFNVWTHFSGVSPYNDHSLSLYNTIFTVFVPVLIFDRIVEKKILLERPKLYVFSKERKTFGIVSVSLWFLSAILHSVVILFVISLTYSPGVTPSKSAPGTLYLGILAFTAISYVVDATFLLMSTSYNFINIVLILCILFFYHIFILVYNVMFPVSILPNMSWMTGIMADDAPIFFVVFEQIADPNAYLALLLAVSICLIILVVFKFLKIKIAPNVIESYKDVQRRFNNKERDSMEQTENRLFQIGGGYQGK